MKLHAACLISVLALTTAQKGQVESGRVERFLADRDVPESELETHATYEDGLWTALDGIVYDISDFVHPGGVKHILDAGGIQADDLYMEAYDAKDHPYTMAEVVSQPGITRIGPLIPSPPTAPVSPAAPVSAASSDAPASVPVATSTSDAPEAGPTRAPTAVDATLSPGFVFSPISEATEEPTKAKESKPTEASTTPPNTAAPTSNGSTIGAFFFGFTTMIMVVVSLA